MYQIILNVIASKLAILTKAYKLWWSKLILAPYYSLLSCCSAQIMITFFIIDSSFKIGCLKEVCQSFNLGKKKNAMSLYKFKTNYIRGAWVA